MKALQAPEKIAYPFDEMGLGKTITMIASALVDIVAHVLEIQSHSCER